MLCESDKTLLKMLSTLIALERLRDQLLFCSGQGMCDSVCCKSVGFNVCYVPFFITIFVNIHCPFLAWNPRSASLTSPP